MNWIIELIRAHGSLVVLVVAFVESLGLPVPTLPFLVVAGALAAQGPVSLPRTLGAAVVGAVAADLMWYELGRRKGRSTLYLFCKLSLNPDACVGRTERVFRASAPVTILTSKLVPGLNALVPPLAGLMKWPRLPYLLLDGAGSLAWAAIGLGLGVVFGTELLPRLEGLQRTLSILLVGLVLLYAAAKVGYRLYLVRHFSVPRLSPAELAERLAQGDLVVVDLRNESAYTGSGRIIPGAIRIPPADFEHRTGSIPTGRPVVLYCT
jgi:membrane protein DedA with SNARE-associated domain